MAEPVGLLLHAGRGDADLLAVMKESDRVFIKYPFFGSHQIAAYLRREGIVIGRHRVRRLMAKMGLEAIYPEEITDGLLGRRIAKNWMTFYNLERPHSALDQRTPGEPYRAGLEEQKQHET
ncbi:IS3 family transposase [Aliiroseovarius crassostreae]|uniref:IS3 family transposase n=1 Tax=Aliiroseovarius crassostreae TaxID=154981 RepID=UPI00220F75DE|nr:IS3 family transposase [Aliiroseovarius crassostreae]UWP99469.1 IS3 family transposase [Aliiroseovarius crassostreae]